MESTTVNVRQLGQELFGEDNKRREARLWAGIADMEGMTPEIMAALPDAVVPSVAAWFNLRESDTATLLDTIAKFIRRYVFLHDDHEAILATWVLHTYVFMQSSFFTPYIFITAAEKACGKSTLMDALKALAHNPRRSGGITAAALVRAVDRDRPVLFLDEMDAQLASSPEFAAAVQGILNEGYRRDGVFTKCDGKENKLRDFAVYCPKVFAGIGNLLHDTTASRSIRIEMRRKIAGEHVELFDTEEAERDAAPIKKSIEQWAKTVISAHALRGFRHGQVKGWDGRQNDTARPLLAIAMLAGRAWQNRVLSALRFTFKTNAEATESFGTMLLSDIRDCFEQKCADRVSTIDLLAYLHQQDERPWPAWGFRHEPMRPHQLAKELRQYHIGPRLLRIEGEPVKGYSRADFLDAWQRFCLPPSRNPVTAVTELPPASLLANSDSAEVSVTALGKLQADSEGWVEL